MICVLTGRIVQGDIDQKIKRWETWFMTPLGLAKTMTEAVELVQKHDLNPLLTISAVSVAICDSTYEVWPR